MACFLLYFTGRRGHPMWHRANVAMSLICRKSQERQARKKFYNKCSENSRSQIVFLTDIFRKLTLGVLEYYPDLFSMKPKARSSKVRKFIIIIILFIIIGYSSCLYILREWRECCHQHALWFLQFIIYKIFFSGRFPFCLPHYDAQTRVSIMTGFNLHKPWRIEEQENEKVAFLWFLIYLIWWLLVCRDRITHTYASGLDCAHTRFLPTRLNQPFNYYLSFSHFWIVLSPATSCVKQYFKIAVWGLTY